MPGLSRHRLPNIPTVPHTLTATGQRRYLTVSFPLYPLAYPTSRKEKREKTPSFDGTHWGEQ
jgi:hypothetical protein